jgi:endonuclease YncB( thermonuclease family)
MNDLADHGYDTPLLNLDGWQGWTRVVDVYDGDTITAVIRFRGEPVRISVRLLGIDTCEIRSSCTTNKRLAYRARDRLLALVTCTETSAWENKSRRGVRAALDSVCATVYMKCEETDKYGRTLANLSSGEETPPFAHTLVTENLAYEYHGGRRLTDSQKAEQLGP